MALNAIQQTGSFISGVPNFLIGAAVVAGGGFLAYEYYQCSTDGGKKTFSPMAPADFIWCVIWGEAKNLGGEVYNKYTGNIKNTAQNIKCCVQNKSKSKGQKAKCVLKHGWKLALGPLGALIAGEKNTDECNNQGGGGSGRRR